MLRYQKDYWLLKRRRKSGVVWYYQIPGQSPKSTGCAIKKDADDWVKEHVLSRQNGDLTLKRFLEPFFTDECFRIKI